MVVDSAKWRLSSRSLTSARSLRELLAWYDDVLGRIAAGALVAPDLAERLAEEQDFTVRYLELLDAGEENSQATE